MDRGIHKDGFASDARVVEHAGECCSALLQSRVTALRRVHHVHDPVQLTEVVAPDAPNARTTPQVIQRQVMRRVKPKVDAREPYCGDDVVGVHCTAHQLSSESNDSTPAAFIKTRLYSFAVQYNMFAWNCHFENVWKASSEQLGLKESLTRFMAST